MPDPTDDGTPFDALVSRLSDPAAYPDNPDDVDVIETHASVAFLAGKDVYKLKKPVDFGFLDYSTPDRRQRMCELEVRLNRRLAPDVYRGVVPVVRHDQLIRIGGEGEIVDYLVHMRRLPAASTLASGVSIDAVTYAEIDAIAAAIGDFHQEAARNDEIDRWGSPTAIRRNVEENFDQTVDYINRTIPQRVFEDISGYARSFLDVHEALLLERKDAGMTREGHGDIRAEHVYLIDGKITIIDCIEFNPRLRCGDVAADVGFLAMDLDAMNRPDLSDRLISTYEEASGFEVTSVLDFYKSYRAYVRGKVTSFRLDGGNGAVYREARRFFHLSHRYAKSDRGPRLILMSGLTGSGKSTLASVLTDALPSAVFDSDTTRKHLAGLDASERQEVAFGAGIYTPEMTERVYRELLDKAEEGLKRGQTIILDATYTNRKDRDAAASLARTHGSSFTIVHCSAPEGVIRQRLTERAGDTARVSDGRWEIYLAQREHADPFSDAEMDNVVNVDTSRPMDEQIEAVLERLESGNSATQTRL